VTLAVRIPTLPNSSTATGTDSKRRSILTPQSASQILPRHLRALRALRVLRVLRGEKPAQSWRITKTLRNSHTQPTWKSRRIILDNLSQRPMAGNAQPSRQPMSQGRLPGGLVLLVARGPA
jgi:hypothetical protein